MTDEAAEVVAAVEVLGREQEAEIMRLSDHVLWVKFGQCLKSKFYMDKLRNLILRVVRRLS